MELSDISASLDSHIQDPDLVISTEYEFSLFGYPPWGLRLSELFHVPIQDHIHDPFLEAMFYYSNCQQRFGR
jgi:dehydrodolichyl diphosphate syntase complex subunit NUS1